MAYCAYGVLTPYRGTPLYDQLVEEGRLLEDRGMAFYNGYNVTFQPQLMNPDDLLQAHRTLWKRAFSPALRIQAYYQGDTLSASGCSVDGTGDEWLLRLKAAAWQCPAGGGVGVLKDEGCAYHGKEKTICHSRASGNPSHGGEAGALKDEGRDISPGCPFDDNLHLSVSDGLANCCQGRVKMSTNHRNKKSTFQRR